MSDDSMTQPEPAKPVPLILPHEPTEGDFQAASGWLRRQHEAAQMNKAAFADQRDEPRR